MKRLIFSLIVMLPLLLSAQYTMPKKVDRKEPTKEQQFIQTNFPHVKISDIPVGSRFMFRESPIKEGEINVPSWLFYHKDWYDMDNSKNSRFWGKNITLTFSGDKKVKPKGKYSKTLRAVMEFECDGVKFILDMDAPMNERTENTPDFGGFNLVWLDEIDKAKQILVGHKFYSSSEMLWYYNEHTSKYPQLMQFVEFCVDDVFSSDKKNAPIRITGTTEFGDKIYFDCSLSDYDQLDGMEKLYNLSKYILIDNLRDKYPYITDENWELIQLRQVKVGMTNVECALAWGEPKDISNIETSNIQQTTYYYREGRALVFENGVLSTIIN